MGLSNLFLNGLNPNDGMVLALAPVLDFVEGLLRRPERVGPGILNSAPMLSFRLVAMACSSFLFKVSAPDWTSS